MKTYLLAALLLTGCAQSSDLERIEKRQDDQNNRLVQLENSVIVLKEKNDSLHNQVVVLAQTNLYLDSVVASKQGKVERAERRGRFVGGLLKGLIPGI